VGILRGAKNELISTIGQQIEQAGVCLGYLNNDLDNVLEDCFEIQLVAD
jgi:hypothetical protein